MSRNKYLEPRARERINEILNANGEITTEEGVKLVMLHMSFDYEDAKKQTAKRVFRNLMAGRKDSSKVRTTFATTTTGESTYVDIDRCENLPKVKDVEQKLYDQEKGIFKSRRKARNRRKILEGQMEMDISKVE